MGYENAVTARCWQSWWDAAFVVPSWLASPLKRYRSVKAIGGIVDLVGKDGHVRTIPIPRWAKEKLDRWTSAATINTGRVCRAIPKNGTVWGDRINENVVWHVVNRYCRSIGLEHVAPA